MRDEIADLRQEYTKASLNEADVGADPVAFFARWLQEAQAAEVPEPTAMNVATVAADGAPSARIVLLKGMHDGKFVFYTNYDSRKGNEIAGDSRAAVTFWWQALERQVRIEGVVTKVSREQSEDYFASRPIKSQWGAAASPQSQVVPNREWLEERMNALEAAGEAVACPEHWGGYQIEPHYIEFWQGRRSRLHDRVVFTKDGDNWAISRIAP